MSSTQEFDSSSMDICFPYITPMDDRDTIKALEDKLEKRCQFTQLGHFDGSDDGLRGLCFVIFRVKDADWDKVLQFVLLELGSVNLDRYDGEVEDYVEIIRSVDRNENNRHWIEQEVVWPEQKARRLSPNEPGRDLPPQRQVLSHSPSVAAGEKVLTDLERVLSKIHDEPDVDAHRYILADFCEETGQAQFALFVRGQLALSQLEIGDSRYPDLLAQTRRSGLLTDPRAIPFVDHVPQGRVTFQRGLIRGVSLKAATLKSHSSGQWQIVPAEQLQLDFSWKDGGDLIARRQELSKISTLWLAGPWTEHRFATFFSKDSCFGGLRHLRLELGCPFPDYESLDEEDAQFRKLMGQVHFPQLKSLSLEDRRSSPRWRMVLAGCKQPLERLHLSMIYFGIGASVDDETEWLSAKSITQHLVDARILLRSTGASVPHFDQPSSLEFFPQTAGPTIKNETYTLSSDDDVSHWANWNNLKQLYVVDASEQASTVSHIGKANHLESLVICSDLDDEQTTHFARGTALSRLRRLGIRTCSPEFLSGSYCSTLHRLDWGGSGEPSPQQGSRSRQMSFTRNDIAALRDAPLAKLRWLTLASTFSINYEDLALLLDSQDLSNLCTLLLPNSKKNPLETSGLLEKLATAPHLPFLSLVGTFSGLVDGPQYGGPWWVLGEGIVKQVVPEIYPIDSDWWANDPLTWWVPYYR